MMKCTIFTKRTINYPSAENNDLKYLTIYHLCTNILPKNLLEYI